MPKQKSVRLCPRCGSAEVFPHNEMDMISWGGTATWRCDSCNYNAMLFPEVDMEEVAELRKGLKDSD